MYSIEPHVCSSSCATGVPTDFPAPCEVLTHDWRKPLIPHDQLRGRQGAAVALGKFDAMHAGHRALAEAAAAMGGYPCLLSFWGMAEVLNLTPRQPLVADCERKRILESWAPTCGGVAPVQRSIPFADIRTMEAEKFVKLLATDLAVFGVVVGANFRFGALPIVWLALQCTSISASGTALAATCCYL